VVQEKLERQELEGGRLIIYACIKRRMGNMRNEYMPERDNPPPKTDCKAYMSEGETSTNRAVADVTSSILTYVCSRTYADDDDVC